MRASARRRRTRKASPGPKAGSAAASSKALMAASGRFRSRSRRASWNRASRARRLPFFSAQAFRSADGSAPSWRSTITHRSMLSRVVSASGVSSKPSRRTSRARASTPRTRSDRANPSRALSRTAAVGSPAARMLRKISEASEGRFSARRTRPRATSSSAAGSSCCPRAELIRVSAVAWSPVESCRSRSRRRVLGSVGKGVPGGGSRARAASASPCSVRMRARSRVASGFSAASGSANLAAISRLPCAAKAAARRNIASRDPRSHGPSSVWMASSGRPAASCARARRSPSMFLSPAGPLRSASSRGAMAACGIPSRRAARDFSATDGAVASAAAISANQRKAADFMFRELCGGSDRCGWPWLWPRFRVSPRR